MPARKVPLEEEVVCDCKTVKGKNGTSQAVHCECLFTHIGKTGKQSMKRIAFKKMMLYKSRK